MIGVFVEVLVIGFGVVGDDVWFEFLLFGEVVEDYFCYGRVVDVFCVDEDYVEGIWGCYRFILFVFGVFV